MFYLAAAFITVWVLVTGYVVYMGNRQRSLEADLRMIEELVEERGKRQG
jgi:CcmD family protein